MKSRVAELICTTKSILCLRKALVPVTRNVKVPTDALELAVTVKVTAVVPPGGGEASVAKLKVTPEGAELTQETDRPIGALKPLIDVTVIVVGALVPWTREIDDGEADREKSTYPVCVMATVSGTLCDMLPLVPIIVTMKDPIGAYEDEDSVISELAEPPAGGAIGFGPNVAVSPSGRPAAANDTADEKLPEDVIVTVADVKKLGATITLGGVTVIVKSPDPVTFKFSDVE